MNWRDDWPLYLFYLFIFGLLVLCFAAVWVSANSPHFMLNKHDWQCTHHKPYTHLQPIQIGTQTQFVPVTSMLCTEYKMKGDDYAG